jgi:hypothetical protein
MKKISISFIIYLVFCSAIAFVDIDWDAESEQSVKASMYKQTLYMNRAQLQVYFDDLSTIDSAGLMGGMNGKRLHGKEVSDIHDLANEIRQQRATELIEFPSKPFKNAVSDFFVIPFHLFMNRN